MVVPRPKIWGRVWTIALLGVFWVLVAPRTASAYGCHDDERPRFGLSEGAARNGLETPHAPSFSGASSQVVPRPCPGETPASPERPIPLGLALMASSRGFPPDLGADGDWPSDAQGREDYLATDLSRPPRTPSRTR